MKDKTESTENNVLDLDTGRFKKLDNSSYFNILEEFECLRIKIMMDQEFEQKDAHRFITLLKWIKDNGHTDSLKMFCAALYKKMLRGEPL